MRAVVVRRARIAAAAAGLMAALALAHARADAAAGELLRSAGAPLLAYAGATHDSGPQTLWLNGAALQLRSGSTRDALEHVLDVYEARCRARARSGPLRLPLGFDGIGRFGTERDAFLGCVDLGDRDREALLQRLLAFASDGDVAQLGRFELVWATRTARGTRYVAVWSAGALPLFRMFPETGDAPGEDVPSLPRPPRSRRLLSVGRAQRAPMIASYSSELDPATLATSYAARLRETGFSIREQAGARDRLLHASRDGLDVLIVLGADDEGGSAISVVPIAAHATATRLDR